MSGIFETYEKEYRTLADDISKNISGQYSTAVGDQRKILQNKLQRELEEADEIIGQMEMELVSLPAQQRVSVSPRVQQYKEELKKFKKNLQKKVASGGADAASERDQLLGGSANIDLEAANMDQRGRLLQGTERLQNSSRRLEDARRIALETEQIGISTLSDLNSQREQIIRTQNRLGTADSWIAKSQGVLKTMQRR
ncbi:t-SNARE VTI1 [Batrachochytrium dendrobatidis]|nr:t-SNARE VTI1 [Batrachochytrium dendrobatidis]KAK5673457.1 t-SNARE VTI1 [Batrachochytrium dendrobatidis]